MTKTNLTYPTEGGSYLRLPDGTLKRLTPQEEAERSARTRKTFSEAVAAMLKEERFSATAVFDRIKECLGMTTDAELAWWFGTTPQSISNRKRRNSVPYAEAIYIAKWANESLDYILTGEHHSTEPPLEEG
jgi:hypothetical protein